MQLEIEYTYYDPYINNRTTGTFKQCIDNFEIAMDRQEVNDNLPVEFLNATIEALDAAIEFIDEVLEPLKSIRNYVFIACLGSWVIWLFKKVSEWISCRTSLANLNECNPYEQTDEGKECRSCLEAKESTANLKRNIFLICDRIMCNSAPTFEKHLRDNVKNPNSHCYEQKKTSAFTYTWKDECVEADNKFFEILSLPTDPGITSDSRYTAERSNSMECCKREYMNTYNSACLSMDELQESGCINHESTEQSKKQGMGLTQCDGIQGAVRTVSGICGSHDVERLVIPITPVQPGSAVVKQVVIQGPQDSRQAFEILRHAEL